MFFKKKKDEFELKTEDSYKFDDTSDSDFFRYEEEVVEPYVARKSSDEFIIDNRDDNDDEIIDYTIDNTYIYDDEDTKETENNYTVNNTYIYTDSEDDNKEESDEYTINNTYIYTDGDDSKNKDSDEYTINNTYVNIENNDNSYNSKRKFYFSPKLIYILNKVFSVLLVITIVIAIMVLFDVIMLTRFSKGPFFAIRTNTYDDGGTKEYYGIGYKVIKYNILNGRRDMVVGGYSIKYDDTPRKITLEKIVKKYNDNYDNFIKEYTGDYFQVSGVVSKVDKKNKKITLKYVDKNKKTYTLVGENVNGDMSKIKIDDSISLKGNLYIDDDNEFYLTDTVIVK